MCFFFYEPQTINLNSRYSTEGLIKVNVDIGGAPNRINLFTTGCAVPVRSRSSQFTLKCKKLHVSNLTDEISKCIEITLN